MVDPVIAVITAACALALFSILYKETIVYRIAERTFIGLGIGYVLYQGVDRIIAYVWTPVTTKGEFVWIIPLALGLLIFTRYIPKYNWIAKWPMALIIGTGLGLAMGGLVTTMIVSLIVSTISLNFSNINNIVFLIITVTSISYFLMTKEHKGALGYSTKIGRICLMAAFGGSMASNVNSFVSRLGGVIETLVIYPGYYVTIIAFILIILDATVLKKVVK